jgi:hypothetical protein
LYCNQSCHGMEKMFVVVFCGYILVDLARLTGGRLWPVAPSAHTRALF